MKSHIGGAKWAKGAGSSRGCLAVSQAKYGHEVDGALGARIEQADALAVELVNPVRHGAFRFRGCSLYNVDFESPTFSVGLVGGNPLYSPGQGGWGGYNAAQVGSQIVYASISDQQAHGGTQSLLTVADPRYLGLTGTDLPYNR